MERSTYPLQLQHQELFDLCRHYSHIPGTTLLASAGQYQCSRISYLGLFSTQFFTLTLPHEDPWGALEKSLNFHFQDPYPEWVGYLGYEMGAYADREKQIAHYNSFMPDLCFYRPACWISYDHTSRQSLLILDQHASLSLEQQNTVQQLIEGRTLFPPLLNSQPISYSLDHVSDTPEKYCAKISQIKDLIRAGEVYQVNISQQLLLKGRGDPFELYQRLFSYNPTPFSAYIQTDKGTIISCSPERLLAKQGSRLETRPIKGTAPRGRTLKEDQKNLRELENSTKEKAELMMITDLMRNDLGRVSCNGSVIVPEIRRCEAYANVFHAESVIISESDPSKSVFEILRACFPGGSITGCPKLSAMQVIQEIEKRPRGIYTGSIGYFCGNGDFDFNIAIRTLWQQKDLINLQLGGAIVIDSDSKKEYEETMHKGASFLNLLQAP